MENSVGNRLKRAFNAFMNRDPTRRYFDYGPGYSVRPDRPRSIWGNERSIITSIYTRIATDVSAVDIVHCRVDTEGRYKEDVSSGLNNCLSLEANIDQTGQAFIQDVVKSMLDEGVVAIVPVDTDVDPSNTEGFSIETMRTGKIIEWYPRHVKVRVYNDRTGLKEDIVLPKSKVGIVENPFYEVMNAPSSTLQRLIRKLSLLDVTDERTASGKLDLIIQLPYTVKTPTKKALAEDRLKSIENQLAGSTYGIAYIDSTEHVTQLNRSLENNLLKQIEYLTNMLFSQLGITQSILDGTANESTMLNYYRRTVNVIVSAIVNEIKRKFLSKTARTQGQTIMAFRGPFELVTVSDIANVADIFSRNEIMTSNEIRQEMGMKPSSDPKADRLENSNINQTSRDGHGGVSNTKTEEGGNGQNGEF